MSCIRYISIECEMGIFVEKVLKNVTSKVKGISIQMGYITCSILLEDL